MVVDFIIPTYNRVRELRVILHSLLAQTCQEWCANVVIDNISGEYIANVVDEFNDARIKSTLLDQRYNDWGHTPRQIGKQQSTADYIVMTGDDNYYTPHLVKEIAETARDNPGLIYWDMVHSHFHYQYFKSALAVGYIDMGAFATRRDIAQSIDLGTRYEADGRFVELVMQRYPNEKTLKINKVLFVHN